MILANILFWLLLFVGGYLAFNAYWLAAHALFPDAVLRCRETYGRRPAAATLVGLAVLVPVLVVGVLALKTGHPLLRLLVIGVLAVPALLALLGSAGLAARIGGGLPSAADGAEPWRHVLRGGSVLGLALAMPVLGWFVLLPWTIASGLGAALLSRPPAEVRSGPVSAAR
jgi:hypothetical protein